jgi:hypothetical protein
VSPTYGLPAGVKEVPTVILAVCTVNWAVAELLFVTPCLFEIALEAIVLIYGPPTVVEVTPTVTVHVAFFTSEPPFKVTCVPPAVAVPPTQVVLAVPVLVSWVGNVFVIPRLVRSMARSLFRIVMTSVDVSPDLMVFGLSVSLTLGAAIVLT